MALLRWQSYPASEARPTLQPLLLAFRHGAASLARPSRGMEKQNTSLYVKH